MCDRPEAFSSRQRKARKIHKCCECREEIKKGDNYQYSSGVWDRETLDFKQCMNCHEIMQRAEALVTEYDPPGFGELRSWFEEFICRDFAGTDWLNGMAKDVNLSPAKLNRLLGVEENNGYWCVVCGRFLEADEIGVIMHDEVPHPDSMTFEETEQ